MKEKGQVGATMGYSNPADGWHTVCVQEGLNLKVNEKSGKESFYVPLMVDEEGEDAGKKIAIFLNTRDENRVPYKSVEKQFANLLANLKLEEAFNTKFPGDVSYIDNPVIEAMKIKLPGQFMMVKVKVDKDRAQIIQLDVVGAKHTEVPKPESKASGSTAASAPKTDW